MAEVSTLGDARAHKQNDVENRNLHRFILNSTFRNDQTTAQEKLA